MTIKHKLTGELKEVSYHTWRKNHLSKHHDTIYDIIDHGKIVLVREVNKGSRSILYPLDYDHALKIVHQNPESYDFIEIDDSIFVWNPKASMKILEQIPLERSAFVKNLEEQLSNIDKEQLRKVINQFHMVGIVREVVKGEVNLTAKGKRLFDYYNNCLRGAPNAVKSIGLATFSIELDLIMNSEVVQSNSDALVKANNIPSATNELLNIYMKVGEERKIIPCVDNLDIEKIFEGIEKGDTSTWVNGRKLSIEDISTFQIYDFSLQKNLPSKGETKRLMEQEMSYLKLRKWNLLVLKQFGVDVTDRFNIPEPPIDPPALKASDNLFPLEILQDTRGYLLRIGTQACTCYDYGLFDASLVMVRKLIETLIIECYERHRIEGKIKDGNDNFYFLSDLIDNFTKETTWNLSRNTNQSLPKIKKFGDLSAHNRRYSAKKADLDKISEDLRIVIEDLIHIIDYANWNNSK